MNRNFISVVCAPLLLTTHLFLESGCATSAPRFPSSASDTSDLANVLAQAKRNIYYGNLHAHHFMGATGSKKNPLSLSEALAPGDCKVGHATFPGDDGRPCRDEDGETNQTILPRRTLADGSPDLIDYFKQACEYGTGKEKGELDILFVTPHTKNNHQDEGQVVTSSAEADLVARHDILSSMNPEQEKTANYYCGMGQEASSISAGNHINIFGQFSIKKSEVHPFFFPSGKFGKLYPEIGARIKSGEQIMLQMNHPNATSDLWLGNFDRLKTDKKLKKTKLNDYGLDDFAPVGCLLGNLAEDPSCAGIAGDSISLTDIKKTYENIRNVSGNPFRFIEVISPSLGDYEEGEAGAGSTTASNESFGATTNAQTKFRKVQRRDDANSYEKGIHNWIFYLSMGFKLAPTANQDNHFMNYGSATASRTGILARDLREGSVLAAMNERKTFATEDVNSRIVLTSESVAAPGKPSFVQGMMGDTLRTDEESIRLNIAYLDPDAGEEDAEVRFYYYRENDVIDFEYSAKIEDAFRTVALQPAVSGISTAILPESGAKGRSASDLVPVRSGSSVTIDLPLSAGGQWVFAEVTQKGDHDKMWTAPIWIEKL